MKEEHKIDQLFQSKLSNYEVEPKHDLWPHIEAELNKDKANTPIFPFWRSVAVISVLLMGSFVSGYYYSNIHKNKIIQTDQKKGQMVGNKENSIPSKEIKSQSSNMENATTINNEEKINQVVAVESNQSKIVKSKIYSKENKKIMNKERLNHAHLISNQENNLIPSSEIKMRKRSVNKKEEALKSMIDSKNEEEAIKNTNLIAENTSTNKTEKIVIRKNNELIELEIIGENKVKVEDSKEEIVNEEKGEVKLDLLKREKEYSKGFFIGTNMGLNLSTLYFSANTTDPFFNNRSSFKASLGYFYGLSLGYDFNKHLGIQSGMNFSRYNFEFKKPNNDDNIIGDLSVFQLDLPILLRYKFNLEVGKKRKLLTITALGGLKYSYVTKYFITGQQISNINQSVVNLQIDRINKSDYHQLGYMVGVEFNYFINKNFYLFSGVFGSLTSSISQFPIFLNNQLEKPSQLSSSISLGIRYQFGKKNKTTK